MQSHFTLGNMPNTVSGTENMGAHPKLANQWLCTSVLVKKKYNTYTTLHHPRKPTLSPLSFCLFSCLWDGWNRQRIIPATHFFLG